MMLHVAFASIGNLFFLLFDLFFLLLNYFSKKILFSFYVDICVEIWSKLICSTCFWIGYVFLYNIKSVRIRMSDWYAKITCRCEDTVGGICNSVS